MDTQYGTILGEAGIIGAMAFLWLVFSLFKNGLRIYWESQDDLIQGISLGFVCSLFALLVMGLGANSFVIVRVMEPFWFIAAMVFVAPQYYKKPVPQAQEDILGT